MCLAVPGKVVSIEGDASGILTGKVSFGGALRDVVLAYLPDVQVGEYVIVHAGFALSKVDEAEALQVFEYLKQMESLSELQDGDAEMTS